MKVIKRNGLTQEFNINKIKTSIINSADDINTSLTESDANLICTQIESKIKSIRKDGSNTSSYEIISVIIDVLRENHFSNILDSYINFSS